MKTISRIMAVTALVSVVGCGKLPNSSLGGTFAVEPFLDSFIPSEGLTGGQIYSAALAREYQSLARIAATEDVNWIDASAYMQKALAAIRGQEIQPWEPGLLGLQGEANQVYQRVLTTLNQNAGRNPIACARAMALYDNYVEELSEGAHACTDPAVILAELNDQLEACGYAEPRQVVRPVAPPPPPVVIAPPPPPVVIAPPPPPVVIAPPVVVAPPPPVVIAPPVVVAPAPVIVEAPAPVIPYDACSTVSVPGNCTCDGASGNPVLTCEKIVEVPVPTEVIREVQVPYAAPPAPVPAPPPPPPVVTDPGLPLNYTIYFGYDRYDLTAEARQVIDEAVAAFRAYAAPFMDIVGHTDTRGSKAYNTRLAQRRADAVAGAVTSRGVDRSSLRVSASSELDPAITTGDGVREALNRRVSISIVQ